MATLAVEASAEVETSSAAGMRSRLVILAAVSFIVFALSPVRQNFDTYLAFPTAYSIVHDQSLDLGAFDSDRILDHYGLATDSNGDTTNYFPWVPSLFLVPSILALDLAHAVGVGPGSFEVANGGQMDLIQQLTASLVMALVVPLVALVALNRLRPSPYRRRVAIGVALAFAFGTAVWSTASRAMWQHGPSMLALAFAVLCLQRGLLDPTRSSRRWVALAGASVAFAYTARPTNSVVVICILAFLLLRRRSLVVPFCLGGAAIGLPWLLANWFTVGQLLPDYNTASRLGLHRHYFEAVAANLVSPARGLIVFSPIVLLGAFGLLGRARLALRSGLLDLDRMLAVAILLHLFAVSGLTQNWWAGHSFGPRFMADTLVFIAVLAIGPTAVAAQWFGERDFTPARRAMVGLFAVALGWSLFVNAQGALIRSTQCWSSEPNIDTNNDRVWDVSDPLYFAGVSAIIDKRSLTEAVFDTCSS